jgi:cysteinyl-tRNA synthetase
MHHYREIWSHNLHELHQASALAYEINKALEVEGGDKGEMDSGPHMEAFYQALEEDLDTPTALDVVQDLVQAILENGYAGKDISQAQNALRTCGKVFGLRLDNPNEDAEVLKGWDAHLAQFQDFKPVL